MRLCGVYSPASEDVRRVAEYLEKNYPLLNTFDEIARAAKNDDILRGMLIDTVNADVLEQVAVYLENCHFLLLAQAVLEKISCRELIDRR